MGIVSTEINPISPLIINIVLVVLSTALAFVSALYFSSRRHTEEKLKSSLDEREKMRERLTDLESKLAVVNAAVVPISTAFQAILIKELTHFHSVEMDALLLKIGPPNILTTEEHTRLIVMLSERMKDLGDEISLSEKDAAYMLPMVMKRSEAEQAILKTVSDMKLKLITVAEVVAMHK
jgi:mevalonate pyrophosphate decarboxylase